MKTGSSCNVRRRRGAFTLIEILIVVIILGILAAIVIPQFTSANTVARTSALDSTIQTLRNEIALYKLQHGDTLPDLQTNGLASLTQTSTYNGATCGPYIQAVPVNTLTNGGTVKNGNFTSNSAGVRDADFVYDFQNGSGTGNIWGAQDVTGGPLLGP